MKKNKGLWLSLFVLIFLLSQDYLFISWEGKPALLGFPIWIVWFAFVHLLFIVGFYFFSKKYWSE